MTSFLYNGITIPERMRHLPIMENGMPLPTFASEAKTILPLNQHTASARLSAMANRRCYICGDKLPDLVSFIGGPDEAMSKLYLSPPVHPECADFILQACPEISDALAPGNPGFFAVSTTANYEYDAEKGVFLISDAEEVWWSKGQRVPGDVMDILHELTQTLRAI
ncbi:hypothetical protein [Acetobacter pasteurianus]|nr:hypothetical protein [Acetobacter pasteurianus]